MTKINNFNTYNNEMIKSMEDKMHFSRTYLTDIKHLVDFGCANGVFLSFTHSGNHNLDLIGIDMNYDMIKEARKKLPSATFIMSTRPIVNSTFHYRESALNLGSVLHEVYFYQDEENINQFWDDVTNSGYKYIFIRDMISNLNDERANIVDVEKVRNRIEYADRIKKFEDYHGSIDYQKNLIHFLLKYRFKLNWNREVKEDYLPLSGSDIVDKLKDNYDIIYRKEYVLPFVKSQAFNDFGINIVDDTHIKLVARRKDY